MYSCRNLKILYIDSDVPYTIQTVRQTYSESYRKIKHSLFESRCLPLRSFATFVLLGVIAARSSGLLL
jgi:hypothetical protein